MDTEIKVELARLTEQVSQIAVTVASIDERLDRHMEESAGIKTSIALLEQRIEVVENKLKAKDKLWGGIITGVGVAVIAALVLHFSTIGG